MSESLKATSKTSRPDRPLQARPQAVHGIAAARPNVRQAITVEIANEQTCVPIDRKLVTRLARFVFVEEGVDRAELSVAFVDNATIHRLNVEFLGHDYPTDVITFPLTEPNGPLQGEIVIGAEYAAEQAPRIGWPVRCEWMFYLVHGILHLCGYEDAAPGHRRLMHRRQTELLIKSGNAEPVAVVRPSSAKRGKFARKTEIPDSPVGRNRRPRTVRPSNKRGRT